MNLDVVFLGTAGSSPTAQRSASATVVRRGGDRLLVDCGEGTQRQLLRSDVGLVDFEDVFLTHLHADHFLGLPGMLKTFALRGRELPITVHGPRGTRELLDALQRIFGRLTFALDVVELDPGDASTAATTGSRRSPSTTACPRSGTRCARTSAPGASPSTSPTGSACRPARPGEPCSAARR